MKWTSLSENKPDRLYLDEPATVINLIHLWGDMYRVSVIYEDGTTRRFQTHLSSDELAEGDRVHLRLEQTAQNENQPGEEPG